MARVPLFPLGTVLVPGATLPLQVFEPRYVVMLSDLLNSMDIPEFGVVAIKQGHEVGDLLLVADLAVRLRKALDTYATTVGAEEQEWAEDPAELSYEVGAAVGLDLLDRQRLLAADDTETRLRLALHLVRREQGLASTMRLVPPPPDRPYNLN